MPQVFHPSMNAIGRAALFAFAFSIPALGLFFGLFYRSGFVTGADTAWVQPVPFSHEHHAGDLNIDCRYCHTSVETSAFAGIPPTATCMHCHEQMWVGSDMLAPVRNSYRSGASIPWQRVHNLPNYVYFNHSIHIAKGVGCASCHGPVNRMPLTWQTKSLLMEWCLQCHRQPEPHLRPRAQVFNMDWRPADEIDPDTGQPADPVALGRRLARENGVRDTATLTSCSTCHR